jgi:hypothetical protein
VIIERMASPEDVRNCYRLLLGRDPENSDAIAQRISSEMTQKTLILSFLQSDEFKLRFGKAVTVDPKSA